LYQIKQKNFLKFISITKKQIKIYKSKETFLYNLSPSFTINIDNIDDYQKVPRSKGNLCQLILNCCPDNKDDYSTIISDIGGLIQSKKSPKGFKQPRKIQLLQKNPSRISTKGISHQTSTNEVFVFGWENEDVINKFIALLNFLRDEK